MADKLRQLENKVLGLDIDNEDLVFEVANLQQEIVIERKKQVMTEQLNSIKQWVRGEDDNEEL